MNGWKNHATWNMNLWYGDVFADMAENGDTITGDNLLEYVYDAEGLNAMPVGFTRDAAMLTFNSVDWDEIAAHYVLFEEDEDENLEIDLDGGLSAVNE